MRTQLCDDLGIEFPIFAFTHCRDVVVAVSKAGGFGTMLSAPSQFAAGGKKAGLFWATFWPGLTLPQ